MENVLFDYLSKYITLTADEKNAIVDLNIFKQYKKDTLLLKKGQYSDYGYFVIKGCIRSFYIIDGVEKTTAFYTEAESLEPQCKINKKPSDCFISCVEDSILMVSNSEMEKEIFEKFPRFESLCRVLSEELLAKNKTNFDNFKIATPEERYLNLLQSKPDLLQRVPQYQIASYLGLTPQSLSRMRKRLLEKSK
ncbi:Crp/Fnr family transcriptional regulator [Aureibaculum sp. 2210JD6-5]|uniref:Crp/Fnr family transcriptional regulator n=1 Tax=Aureibaculum sp. 2210JD6-5 TaxID=3103957 RepID=UPI002AAE8B01|nr:Crp/Fnr family transcriptional regulator [Aureibaculum sp. 2210JD6-5]MDY7396127.1 Crp/Fnr family transcriptional regulator [Aureibaculum sp. 2210JD6-5]